TNQPLDDPAFRKDRFRDDLWYRLETWVVRVPPLCERREDVRAFLERSRARGADIPVAEALTPEALALVEADPLPGNFRDLINFVRRLPAKRGPHGISAA